ncbi:MAG: hypothetical protein ACRDGH_17335, partial [Candidatus Limnocylindria bacterium]
METLTPDLAGPVSVSQFARHAAAILRAVRENGQVVPISVSHQIVAVLRPTSTSAAAEEVDLDDEAHLVAARDIEQTGPSRWVQRAEEGDTLAVTYQGRPFALLGPASSWTELDDLFDRYQRVSP